MLVYYKIPKGVLYIGKQPIYGREDGHDPADVSFQVYESCKDVLEDATYREGYLREKFAWNQGEVAFTYNELRWFPEEYLRKIARGIGLDESSFVTHKQVVENIKWKLRHVITS